MSCGLNFAPCTFDGTLYDTVPVIQDLGFNVIDPMDFAESYIGCPAYGVLVCCLALSIQAHAIETSQTINCASSVKA